MSHMNLLFKKFRCWFSNNFWDIHDYKDSKDLKYPMHFYEHTCERCGKIFYI